MRKLGSFGTRDLHSATDSPTQGIGAARRWLLEELKSYSSRLEVRADSYQVKKQGRVLRDLELVNVVAVLPGTTQRERQVILAAHYDSLSLARNTDAATRPAPGVSDDASGVASVLELARVMSRREWKKTLVFVLFAGEEQGLIGSRLHAEKLLGEKAAVDAVFSMDIIGDEAAGNGRKMSHLVRLFSAEPADSPSRALARYAREMADRYVPSMKVDLIFRADRFGRGGDHTPFAQRGYAAVRFTGPNENYAHQHSADDTFENSSPDYTARVARVNLAAAACLASAPRTPVVTQSTGVPLLGRGKSGYDAALRWTHAAEPDLAGFAVVIRSTTAPFWEREIFAGNVKEFTLENVSIDDLVIGVKAVGNAGSESPVAAYVAIDRTDPIR
jgi:Zn-dependent M28 family amino/carboxypeptidase